MVVGRPECAQGTPYAVEGDFPPPSDMESPVTGRRNDDQTASEVAQITAGIETAIIGMQASVELLVDRWARRVDSRFERLEAALREQSNGLVTVPKLADDPFGRSAGEPPEPPGVKSCAALNAAPISSMRTLPDDEWAGRTLNMSALNSLRSEGRRSINGLAQMGAIRASIGPIPSPKTRIEQQYNAQSSEASERKQPPTKQHVEKHQEIVTLDDDLDSTIANNIAGPGGVDASRGVMDSSGQEDQNSHGGAAQYKVREQLARVASIGETVEGPSPGEEHEYQHSRGNTHLDLSKVKSGRNVGQTGHPWVVHPASQKRLMWDVIGMVLIGYDLFAIPFQLAFELATEGFLQVMFFTSLTFWTCDIVLTFFSGYYDKGIEVVSIKRIALRYFRTWFTFDMFVVCSDWLTFLSSGERLGGLARLGKSLRVIRVARSLRLLRLVKLQLIIDEILEHVESEYLHITADMMKGMVFVFGLNHVIACTWYGISVMSSDNKRAWIRDGHFQQDDEMAYKYLTSLHWSITQFTPASMEVFPCNTHERAFTVCVLIFALLVLSSFLSSITASVTQLRQLSWKYQRQTAMLRKYLRRRFISQGLSMRIMSFVDWKRHSEVRELRDSDVVLLGSLSEQLRVEMTQEICEPTLCGHPFFSQYSSLSYVAMGRVCTQAVRRFALSVGDVIFDWGVQADSMIFLLLGRLSYVRNGGDSPMAALDSRNDCNMEVGDWCSEAALWTQWVHVGTLQAQGNSEVLAVDAVRFLDVTLKDQNVLQTTIRYSSMFISMLNEQVSEGGLSDLISRHVEFDMNKDLSESQAPRASVQRIVNFFNRQTTKNTERRRRASK